MGYLEDLGKTAIARTTDGTVHGKGRIISHCDAPTYTIEREDGTRFSWRADLCEVIEEYSYQTSGYYDQSGYVVYAPDGKRIEPWDLVELLNAQRQEAKYVIQRELDGNWENFPTVSLTTHEQAQRIFYALSDKHPRYAWRIKDLEYTLTHKIKRAKEDDHLLDR